MALRNLSRIVFPASLKIQPTSIRNYARWMNRNPAKVLLPFEPADNVVLKKEKVIDLSDAKFKTAKKNVDSSVKKVQSSIKKDVKTNSTLTESVEPQATLSPVKRGEILKKKDEKLKRRNLYLSQLKVFDDNGDIIYEKVMENDARVSTILLQLKSKKERARSKLTLVEGWRLIVDGLQAKCKLKYLMFSHTEDLSNIRPFLPKTGVKIYKMPYKDIELWSDTETPQGVFGIFEKPQPDNIRRLSRPFPVHFICDNIRVPGNLGAILRVAVGAGCEKVLLTKGCVDAWDPKVLRSASGAHFRLPIHSSINWEEIPSLLDKDTSIFIAESNVTNESMDEKYLKPEEAQTPVIPYYAVDYPMFKHITLIIGGETEGISEQSYGLAASKNGVRINIPLQKGVDSLNTGMATAVIAFEIKKQLIQAWSKAKLGALSQS